MIYIILIIAAAIGVTVWGQKKYGAEGWKKKLDNFSRASRKFGCASLGLGLMILFFLFIFLIAL